MGPSTDPIRTYSQGMEDWAENSFCTRRGTDTMAHGSLNEDPVTTDLLEIRNVDNIASVDPIARREDSYYAASLDGIAALDMFDATSGSTGSLGKICN